MPTAITQETEKQVARPLRVLVPLIKEDLKAGETAGMPFFAAAGEKLIEAKTQMAHGEFGLWLKRNFPHVTQRQAQVYMRFALATADGQKRIHTLRDSERHSGNANYGRPAAWQEPVRQIMGRVDLERLREAELSRVEERATQRKLALQLIDIGYKTLATKLHPDKGGSRDAMSRLNQVRDRLKASA